MINQHIHISQRNIISYGNFPVLLLFDKANCSWYFVAGAYSCPCFHACKLISHLLYMHERKVWFLYNRWIVLPSIPVWVLIKTDKHWNNALYMLLKVVYIFLYIYFLIKSHDVCLRQISLRQRTSTRLKLGPRRWRTAIYCSLYRTHIQDREHFFKPADISKRWCVDQCFWEEIKWQKHNERPLIEKFLPITYTSHCHVSCHYCHLYF